MVQQSTHMQVNVTQDEWLKQAMQKSEEIFHNQIQDMVLEKDHNNTFIDSLLYKIKSENLNERFQDKISTKRDRTSYVKEYNNDKIYNRYP